MRPDLNFKWSRTQVTVVVTLVVALLSSCGGGGGNNNAPAPVPVAGPVAPGGLCINPATAYGTQAAQMQIPFSGTGVHVDSFNLYAGFQANGRPPYVGTQVGQLSIGGGPAGGQYSSDGSKGFGVITLNILPTAPGVPLPYNYSAGYNSQPVNINGMITLSPAAVSYVVQNTYGGNSPYGGYGYNPYINPGWNGGVNPGQTPVAPTAAQQICITGLGLNLGLANQTAIWAGDAYLLINNSPNHGVAVSY